MTSLVQALGGVDLNAGSFSILRKKKFKIFLDVSLGDIATLKMYLSGTSRRWILTSRR